MTSIWGDEFSTSCISSSPLLADLMPLILSCSIFIPWINLVLAILILLYLYRFYLVMWDCWGVELSILPYNLKVMLSTMLSGPFKFKISLI